MKKFFITLMIAMGGLSMVLPDAEARRMGGGGSFGKRSQMTRPAPAQQAPSQANSTAPAKPAAAPSSPWRNILGGALLGLGLGALLSHLGIGGALASMISTILMVALLAFAVMFIYRMFRRKTTDANAKYAYAGGSGHMQTPEIGSRREPFAQPAQPAAFQADAAASGNAAVSGVPADFDVPAFLRNAKTYFIRLQAAWDRADVNDIREFTSPEMFAELKMQLQERGASPNHTDVVSLDAELLGVETTDGEYLASVRFSGMIKEAEDAPAEPFTEIWNLAKPVSGAGGWTLAGIQQES
jgi:predicted lipid-binding transport protein (Tim44 family)